MIICFIIKRYEVKKSFFGLNPKEIGVYLFVLFLLYQLWRLSVQIGFEKRQ